MNVQITNGHGDKYNEVPHGLIQAGRYFFDIDADILARYLEAMLRKHCKEEDFERYYNGWKADDILDRAHFKGFPCIAFISGTDYVYGQDIGTFHGEIEKIRGYCEKQGYKLYLAKDNDELLRTSFMATIGEKLQ